MTISTLVNDSYQTLKEILYLELLMTKLAKTLTTKLTLRLCSNTEFQRSLYSYFNYVYS